MGVLYPSITIDLVSTSYIDASILNILASVASRRLRRKASQIKIVNANAHLRKLFAICSLEKAFGLEEWGEFTGSPAVPGPLALDGLG